MHGDSHLRLICKKGVLSRVAGRMRIQISDFKRPEQATSEG